MFLFNAEYLYFQYRTSLYPDQNTYMQLLCFYVTKDSHLILRLKKHAVFIMGMLLKTDLCDNGMQSQIEKYTITKGYR